MKQLHGAAEGTVARSAEECLVLVADVEGYERWYPEVVRSVTVLDSSPDGQATRVQVSLHVAHGPLARGFDLAMSVEVEPPEAVRLARISHGPSDGEAFAVAWRISGEEEALLRVELDARLAVPRLLPLGNIGDSIAAGFLAAATRAMSVQ